MGLHKHSHAKSLKLTLLSATEYPPSEREHSSEGEVATRSALARVPTKNPQVTSWTPSHPSSHNTPPIIQAEDRRRRHSRYSLLWHDPAA
eukprot:scaffold1687_cov405-Prasinococcus_capsulatus_cf.AAC.29